MKTILIALLMLFAACSGLEYPPPTVEPTIVPTSTVIPISTLTATVLPSASPTLRRPTPTRMPSLTPATSLPTSTPPKGSCIQVDPDGSLGKIARAFDVSVTDLVRWNKDRYPSLISNPNLVQPDWWICIGDR